MIHKQALKKALDERDSAVEAACRRVAQQAESERVEAVEAAVRVLKLEHEKEVKAIHRKYKKEIKEEIPKVEAKMRSEADSRVLAEQLAGEQRLAIAVHETKEGFASDKLAAVKQAREEEKKVAEENYQIIRDDAAKKLSNIAIVAAKEKEEAILAVQLQKDYEREVAVKQAVVNGEEKVQIVREEIERNQEAYIKKVESLIAQHQQEVEQLHRQIELSMAKRQAIFNELQLLRTDYKAFVDRHKIFDDPGQSEYMVPQCYLQHFDQP